MVLLQYKDGSQELLERFLVQNWLALRAGSFSLHVGGFPRTRDADTGSARPDSSLDASLGRTLPVAIYSLYSTAVVEWLEAIQELGFRMEPVLDCVAFSHSTLGVKLVGTKPDCVLRHSFRRRGLLRIPYRRKKFHAWFQRTPGDICGPD